MWRSGENTRLLRKRSRVRFPHSANICVHTRLVVLGLGISIYNMYVFTKQIINPLSRIHNTSLISAYFGLESRECKC
jgi:hypothetical protein